MPLLHLFYGQQPLEAMERAGVAFSGNRELAKRFVALFALPPKIG